MKKLLIAALLCGAAFQAQAATGTTKYYSRQVLANLKASQYTGTWSYGAPVAGQCISGSKATTAAATCSGGNGQCDPSTKPADKVTTATCKSAYTCPAMTKGTSHSGSGYTSLGTVSFSTAAQTALDGHTLCENSTTYHTWCTMTIPATASAGDQVTVTGGTGGSYGSGGATSYATFTCNNN